MTLSHSALHIITTNNFCYGINIIFFIVDKSSIQIYFLILQSLMSYSSDRSTLDAYRSLLNVSFNILSNHFVIWFLKINIDCVYIETKPASHFTLIPDLQKVFVCSSVLKNAYFTEKLDIIIYRWSTIKIGIFRTICKDHYNDNK